MDVGTGGMSPGVTLLHETYLMIISAGVLPGRDRKYRRGDHFLVGSPGNETIGIGEVFRPCFMACIVCPMCGSCICFIIRNKVSNSYHTVTMARNHTRPKKV
jgi:hypothetical protein